MFLHDGNNNVYVLFSDIIIQCKLVICGISYHFAPDNIFCIHVVHVVHLDYCEKSFMECCNV